MVGVGGDDPYADPLPGQGGLPRGRTPCGGPTVGALGQLRVLCLDLLDDVVNEGVSVLGGRGDHGLAGGDGLVAGVEVDGGLGVMEDVQQRPSAGDLFGGIEGEGEGTPGVGGEGSGVFHGRGSVSRYGRNGVGT